MCREQDHRLLPNPVLKGHGRGTERTLSEVNRPIDYKVKATAPRPTPSIADV